MGSFLTEKYYQSNMQPYGLLWKPDYCTLAEYTSALAKQTAKRR